MLRNLADLVAVFDAALARVWLEGPGDSCATCVMREECPARARCLHLAASVGLHTRLDGPFRRYPIGARQVGRVFAELRPLVVDRDLDRLGIADPLWLARHGIRAFAAIPLHREGRGLGVLALFARRALDDADRRALTAAGELLALGLSQGGRPGDSTSSPVPLRSLAEIERDAIQRTLAATGWRVSGPRGAAGILGLKPTTLHSRMRKLGVRRPS